MRENEEWRKLEVYFILDFFFFFCQEKNRKTAEVIINMIYIFEGRDLEKRVEGRIR